MNAKSEANLLTGQSIKLRSSVVSMMSSLSGFSVHDDFRDNAIKLDVSNVKLFERSREYKTLQESYNRVRNTDTNKKGSSEVILVHGASGTGKSSLVETLRSRVVQDDGYFVVGKFDQIQRGDPYLAIVSAFADLCDLIFQSPDKDTLVANIKKELGGDTQVLSRLVYNLTYLMGGQDGIDDESPEPGRGNAPFIRFKLLCCSFLRAVSSPNHPIAIFIDDLQWADEGSIQVIKALMSDSLSKHILIILACGDEDGDAVQKKLGLSTKRAFQFPNQVIDIHLDNLGPKSIALLLAQLLSCETDEARSLADVVMKKTHGNPYFAIQFLELLQAKRLLKFSEGSGCWEWDAGRIFEETNVSDNVVELVSDKVYRLNRHVRTILLLAAFLGFQFEIGLLEMIVVSECDLDAVKQNVKLPEAADDNTDADISMRRQILGCILDMAVKDGLLEKSNKDKYKFSHNKVQQCLYDMVEESSERCLLHKRIGEIIQSSCKDDNESGNLFLSSDHLNRVPSRLMNEAELEDLVRLNLAASKLAVSKSAFIKAAEYLRHGIARLDQRKRWTKNYALTLDLYSSSAELEYCTGNNELSAKMVEDVLLYSKSPMDSVRAYHTKVNSLGSQGRLDEATNVAQTALAQLGEQLPKKATTKHFIVEMFLTRRTLSGRTDTRLLSLPTNADARRSATMGLLAWVTLHSVLKNDFKMAGVASLRMMRRTCQYGAGPETPTAFAIYSMLLSFLGKYTQSYRFGMLALKLNNNQKSRSMKCQVIQTINTFALHWKDPLESVADSFLRAYQIGMTAGETELALHASRSHVAFSFLCGRALIPLEKDMRDVCTRLADYGKQSTLSMAMPYWQAVQNLIGRSENRTTLTGDVMDEREIMIDAELSKNSVALGLIALLKLILMCVFQDWTDAKTVLNDLETHEKALNASATAYIMLFYTGILYFSLYDRTGARKYVSRTRKIIRRLKELHSNGVTNCELPLAILLAEQTRIKNEEKRAVQDAFEKAITIATRIQSMHYGAIACERAGQAMLRFDDNEMATNYLTKAVEMYCKWNATAKVDWIEEKYSKSSVGKDPEGGILADSEGESIF